MNKQRMSWKNSLAKYCTWSYCAVLFILVYVIFAVFRYYEKVYTGFFMWNVFIPLMIFFIVVAFLNRKQIWTPALGFFILYICIVAFMDALNTGKSYRILNERIIKTTFYGLVCFTFVFALPKENRQKILHAFLHVYLAFVTFIFLWALYAVMSGNIYESPSGQFLGTVEHTFAGRLSIFANPNTGAALAGLSTLLSVYMALAQERIWRKTYYVILAIITSTTLALTDSKTNMLCVAASMGLLFFVVIRAVFRGKGVWKWLLGLAGAAMVVLLCFQLFSLEIAILKKLAEGNTALLPAAKAAAEDAAQGIIVPYERSFFGNGSFAERVSIWKTAFTAMKENPHFLFLGASSAVTNELVFDHFSDIIFAMHNEYITVLFAGGIFALLSFLGFLFCVARKSLRLLLDTSEKTTLAMRFLPSIVLYCVLNALVESQFFLSSSGPRAYEPLLYIAAGYIYIYAAGLPKRNLLKKGVEAQST